MNVAEIKSHHAPLLQAGLTLVEVVIAMAITVTVLVAGLPAFQTAIGNAQTRTVANGVREALMLARSEAIKRNAAIRFTLAPDTGWQMGCVVESSTCPAILMQKAASEGSSSQISVQADAYSVIFSVFGTRDGSLIPLMNRIDISNPSVSAQERKRLRVLLTAGGVSRVCDLDVTTTGDPRIC